MIVLARALPLGNGHSLRTKIFRSLLVKFPTFQVVWVYVQKLRRLSYFAILITYERAEIPTQISIFKILVNLLAHHFFSSRDCFVIEPFKNRFRQSHFSNAI